jgi:hypothetical protein
MIPPFVARWPHEVIVLVWQGLPDILSSGLLKDKCNTRNWEMLFSKEGCPYRVVVFDCYPSKLPSSLQNMYGGYPVLVYDVSTLPDRKQLNALATKKVYAFNLPYYLAFAMDLVNSGVRAFYPLIENGKRISEETRDEAILNLHKRTNHLDWNVMCCCCFQDMGGLGRLFHEGMDGTEHKICESCTLFDLNPRCNHFSHGVVYDELDDLFTLAL